MANNKDSGRKGHNNNPLAERSAQPPALTLDLVKYARYVDGFDLSEEQKVELLHAAWSIVVAFVDLGFRIDPVHQACGQDGGSAVPSPPESAPVVNSSLKSLIDEFDRESAAEKD